MGRGGDCVWKRGTCEGHSVCVEGGWGLSQGVSRGRGKTPEGDTDSSAASNSSSQALWNVMKHDPP
jgi:hypothetical protein